MKIMQYISLCDNVLFFFLALFICIYARARARVYIHKIIKREFIYTLYILCVHYLQRKCLRGGSRFIICEEFAPIAQLLKN